MTSSMAESLVPEDLPVTYIHASRGWRALNLRELWHYRELLYFLTWRNVKVRYKQTVLGASWAILQPVLSMVIFTIIFGNWLKVSSNNIPYPLMTLTALVPWTFFSNGLTQSSNSLIASGNLLTKVYFPRLAIPTSSVLALMVDFVLSFGVLIIIMAAYGYYPSAHILWIPVLVALTFCTSLGIGLWLSGLNVQFRDVSYLVPFLSQAWLYASPVVFPGSMVPEKWRMLYSLNPMAGIIEGFRWALLGTDVFPGGMILVSAVVSLCIFISGAFYFRRLERHFSDVV